MSNVLFLEQYSHVEGPKESVKPLNVHFDDIYLDFLADLFGKDIYMAFGG